MSISVEVGFPRIAVTAANRIPALRVFLLVEWNSWILEHLFEVLSR